MKHLRASLELSQGSRGPLVIGMVVVALAEVPDVKLLEARWCLDELEQIVGDRRLQSDRTRVVPIYLEAWAGQTPKRLVVFEKRIVLFVLSLEPHLKAKRELETLGYVDTPSSPHHRLLQHLW